MSSKEVKLGQRVYLQRSSCRLECAVKSIHSEPLPDGTLAVTIQNGGAGDWVVGLHEIEDADTVDAAKKAEREAEAVARDRRRLAPVIDAWASGLRKSAEIAKACDMATAKAANQIKQSKNKGFITDETTTNTTA